MIPLQLPPDFHGEAVKLSPECRQITLVGANGAGKSRFMDELMRLCGSRAYCLSALKAGFPQTEVSAMPGSVDDLYRRMVNAQPYMRTDAVSEIDKLTYMLFIDEFEYLLSVKNNNNTPKKTDLRPTKLDRLTSIWETLFPNNRIIRHQGVLMFTTGAGSDIISINSLSQGEKAVFYYLAAVLFAPHDAVVFVDSPSQFLHPAILNNLWNSIEQLRADCIFVYDSVDEDFVATRTQNICVWIKSYDSENKVWNYEILESESLSDDLFLDLIGSRNPILFIEGDARHSIDAKLYTLIFSEYSVKPLGSCDKVIETTRTFNDLRYMHHLNSMGIVDRDRRSEQEVEYLRKKNIMVPEVAEVENLFLLEDVIRIMSNVRGRNSKRIIDKVKREVIRTFHKHAEEQALQHVRHKVKREVECKIDARFSCITAMETHLRSLVAKLKPRQNYMAIRSEFEDMVRFEDYAAILKVFNHKPMLSECGVAHLLGYSSKEAYIAGVLSVLKSDNKYSKALKRCFKFAFGIIEQSEISASPKDLPAKLSRRKQSKVSSKKSSNHKI